MNDNYAKACSEVLAIIPYIEKGDKEKISTSFINTLEKLKDKNYTFNFEPHKNLKNQQILRETKIILALIYRDFLCTKEERQELLANEKIEREKIEKEKQEKYEINFEKYKENKNKISNQENELTLVKTNQEKWYQKIIHTILKIFKKST